MNSAEQKIRLVDQITVKPGQGRAFLRAYMERYVPGALARGLVLEQRWVSPPLWLEEQSNTLVFVWTLRGAQGFWAMSFQGRQDPALQDWWWGGAQAMVESRQRYIAGDADLLDGPP
jgi:hypothetical protein